MLGLRSHKVLSRARVAGLLLFFLLLLRVRLLVLVVLLLLSLGFLVLEYEPIDHSLVLFRLLLGLSCLDCLAQLLYGQISPSNLLVYGHLSVVYRDNLLIGL